MQDPGPVLSWSARWPLMFKNTLAASGRSWGRYTHTYTHTHTPIESWLKIGSCPVTHTRWKPTLNHINSTDIELPKLGHVFQYMLRGEKKVRTETNWASVSERYEYCMSMTWCCGHHILTSHVHVREGVYEYTRKESTVLISLNINFNWEILSHCLNISQLTFRILLVQTCVRVFSVPKSKHW